MCIASQQLDSKRRRWRVLGNISLVLALVVWTFFARSGHGNRLWLSDWIDAFCGLLFGFSIGLSFLVLRKARRCRQA